MMDLAPEARGPDSLPAYARPEVRIQFTHPRVYVTPEELARAREKIELYEWARSILRHHQNGARRWLEKPAEELRALIPPQHALFDRSVDCPVCGDPCRTSFDRIGKATRIKEKRD